MRILEPHEHGHPHPGFHRRGFAPDPGAPDRDARRNSRRRIVGCAESPDEAIAGILRTNPDCVVLDYQLIDGTAVDVLRAVHPVSPATVFLVLTNHPIPQYRRVCLEAGASRFFDKSLEFGKVRDAIANLDPLPH